MFEIADAIPNMGSMGHFQVSSTHIREFLKLMKFWSNLGLVRTLKLGEFKENRFAQFSRYRCSRLADAIPNMGSMDHFQVSSTHITEF